MTALSNTSNLSQDTFQLLQSFIQEERHANRAATAALQEQENHSPECNRRLAQNEAILQAMPSLKPTDAPLVAWFMVPEVRAQFPEEEVIPFRPHKIRLFAAAHAEQFGKITRISLTHLNLKALPQELFASGGLMFCDLSNNFLPHVPADISKLRHLQQLDLSHNDLHEFPTAVCSLGSLTELDLTGNAISHVPEEVGQLGALSVLRMTDNPTYSIAPSLRVLPHDDDSRDGVGFSLFLEKTRPATATEVALRQSRFPKQPPLWKKVYKQWKAVPPWVKYSLAIGGGAYAGYRLRQRYNASQAVLEERFTQLTQENTTLKKQLQETVNTLTDTTQTLTDTKTKVGTLETRTFWSTIATAAVALLSLGMQLQNRCS